MSFPSILHFSSVVFVLLLTYGCGPSSSEDFQREGEALSRNLQRQFARISTREDLLSKQSALEHQFQEFVALIIAAREYQDRHPEGVSNSTGKKEFPMSDRLRLELNRIYKIEGAREIVEAAQKEALIRLDTYEHRRRQKLKAETL